MRTKTIYPICMGNMDGDNVTTIGNPTTSFFPVGQFGGTQKNRSLMDFRPTVIEKDATSITGNLLLTVNSNFISSGSYTLEVYLARRVWRRTLGSQASWSNYRQDQTAAWTSAGASDTTNDRSATTIGTYTITSSTSGQITIALDSTLLTAWLTGTTEYHGLLFQMSDETATTLVRFDTVDATNANKPQIALSYLPTTHQLTDNIINYWTFNDLTGADATGNNHTLTYTGSPTNAAGKISNALAVNGTTQYGSNNDAALKIGALDFTNTGWLYITDTVTFREFGGSGHETNTPFGGYLLIYHGSATSIPNLVVQLIDSSGNIVSDTVDAAYEQSDGGPKVSLPISTWIFFAVRHDATRKYWELFTNYLDGNGLRGPASSTSHNDGGQYGPYPGFTTSSYTPANPTGIYAVGADPDLTTFLQGSVDEWGVWSRWLSDEEVTSVMNANINGISYPFVASNPIKPLLINQSIIRSNYW